MHKFEKSFTQQEALDEAAIEAALQVMQSGRLHRYNTILNEASQVDLLEQEFAEYIGTPYCLACSSGGYAIHVAMRAAGVKPGDKVLCNAFTLAPVPGAIHNSGAIPLLVDVGEDFCIDLDDLQRKAASEDTNILLLSHMRGHLVDMERVTSICKQYGLLLIEDCAHTMGASWNDIKSGLQADIACYSTQTYKHINSGEGGLLTTSDDELMAKAIIYSGSYMFFDQHKAAPPANAFDALKYTTPNYSGRMDNLRAAILRPQLQSLDKQCRRWNRRYKILENGLAGLDLIYLPTRPEKEQFVGSSIQFSLPGFSEKEIAVMLSRAKESGITLKWFGDQQPKGYTSRFDSWQYIKELPSLEKTKHILSTMLDMRIPLTFSQNDCKNVAEIIVELVKELR